MANPTTANVLVGKPLVTGGILVAPVGTALPPDVSTALNAAFVAAGYVSDDGLTKSDSIDTGTIRAWGGAIIAVTQTGREVTFQFTLAEHFNPLSHSLVYGDAAVTTTAASSTQGTRMKVSASATAVTPAKAYVFEVFGSGTQRDRIVVPNAIVSDLGDVQYQDGDVTARQVTITALPDAAGNYFYEYTDDGVKSV